jgi:hypothetical protein
VRARGETANVGSGLDPADARHGDIEHGKIGLELAGQPHRLGAVGRLGDHTPIRLADVQCREPFAEQGVVVAEEDREGHGRSADVSRSRSSRHPSAQAATLPAPSAESPISIAQPGDITPEPRVRLRV